MANTLLLDFTNFSKFTDGTWTEDELPETLKEVRKYIGNRSFQYIDSEMVDGDWDNPEWRKLHTQQMEEIEGFIAINQPNFNWGFTKLMVFNYLGKELIVPGIPVEDWDTGFSQFFIVCQN